GKIQGAVIIPPQYSKMVYEKNHPRIALIVDNSDNFMSSTLEDEMTSVTDALNQPDVSPRLLQQTALEVVELYPYIEYMKFLLPGSISLAMFVAVMTGVVITLVGSLLAGVGTIFQAGTIVGLLLMIVLTSLAFNSMMFLLMA